MTRLAGILLSFVSVLVVGVIAPAVSSAIEPPCELTPRAKCFGIQALDASLSTTEAGAHPNLTFTFDIKQDPASEPNVFGLHDGYAATRDVRMELPPGLIGDPNVLGAPQQCSASELARGVDAKCPGGAQVGIAQIYAYGLKATFTEPVYMMQPPGGDVVARLGFIAGLVPTFVDARVRSESDYGLTTEIVNASTLARLVKAETTVWGVPADHVHDNERCTPLEAFNGCVVSPSRPPGSVPLPFFTNPTRCGSPLEMRVSASSWVEPDRFDAKSDTFPTISECDKLPFAPSLTMSPTSQMAAAPVGLGITISLPASKGVKVLEPAQTRYIRIDFPTGLAINTGLADGLTACSPEEVHFEERVPSNCPEASKIADAEFEIPVLERRMKGAIYVREPEPDDPFRIWIVADDLGLHVKLPGELEVSKVTGQIHSIVVGTPKLEGLPQAPLREVKLELKSGFRAPLVNPQACGRYPVHYEFVPWSGGPPLSAQTTIEINEGCHAESFAPKLSAGTTEASAGVHAPFHFALTRQDAEQNPQGLDVALPPGLAATFAGIPRCEGAAAASGACPPSSKIGKVVAAVGAGPAPLWVPQEGKRPTALYLGGPYKGAALSAIAVVPRQAGPFDFGDEVVRSSIYVDRTTGQATAKADPLPQMIEGVPVRYRVLDVQLDRPGFALNPTNCSPSSVRAVVTSSQGTVATPSTPFTAVNCARLPFKPRISFRLRGGTERADHPSLRAVLTARPGDANIAKTSVALPHSEFLDQGHIQTICTRIQFAEDSCPAGSIYGHVEARTPLFNEVLSGSVYLRSSSHSLPDLVVALKGPPALPVRIDLVGRIDSVNGGIRTTFETVPDAPVSNFILTMLGGAKGLLINSTNLCDAAQRATAKFAGQNGRQRSLHPRLDVSCKRSKKHTSAGQ